MRREPGRAEPGPRWSGAEWGALGLLVLFTFLAIGGYGVFGRNPHLIPDSEGARRFYGFSFPLFARVHILLAGAVLALPLVRRVRAAWIPAFLLVFGVSFLSEFIGTGYGIPFGGYAYTSLLGLKLGGRVPAVIPLSWFLMTVPSWVVAHALLPGEARRLGRIVLGAYLLTAWDLALDPAMSHLTPYWVWEDSGPFYGMPWVNLLGWMGTGMALMTLMEALGSERWAGHLPLPWMAAYYGVILLMPLGMVAVAGLWGAVLATGLALLPVWGLHRALSARRSLEVSPTLASERGLS
jgi:putative membrane protein